jgi:hypothetical protein
MITMVLRRTVPKADGLAKWCPVAVPWARPQSSEQGSVQQRRNFGGSSARLGCPSGTFEHGPRYFATARNGRARHQLLSMCQEMAGNCLKSALWFSLHTYVGLQIVW